jgi:transposase InsO family protein
VCGKRVADRRKKRKHLLGEGVAQSAANQGWRWIVCMTRRSAVGDFGALSVIDKYTREYLALEVDTSFANRRVTRELELERRK